MKCIAAAALGLALAGLVALTACGGSDEVPPRKPPVLLEEPPAICKGANLAPLSTLVYVRSDGSDAAGCGTTTAGACASIQSGINACAATGCGVLVRHGVYDLTTQINLRDGVSVYGGCLFDGETGRSYRSVINGPADQPAVSAASIATATVFQHFVVRAGDSLRGGSASVAMAVSSSSGLALNEVRLVAGRGAPGVPGASVGAAGAGQPGSIPPYNFGGAACNGSVGDAGRGGLGGINQITGVSGCFIDCACTNALTAPGAGNPSPGGAPGGVGGTSAGGAGCACAPRASDSPGVGDSGLAGAAGTCSAQPGAPAANLTGTFDAAGHWQPLSGGAGVSGDIGAGGGGGHAGGIAVDIANGNYPYSGGGGSGGGGGGCGGLPGTGGSQGGASIALAVDTIGTVDAFSVLVAGPGGNGGVGGQGGIGGTGGRGGVNGGGNGARICLDKVGVPGDGGAGGNGGAGGAGSGGAGGNGGPSIGLAALTSAAVALKFNAAYPGTPGNGGPGGGGGAGGLANCSAVTGQPGATSVAAATFDYSIVTAQSLEPGQTLRNGGVLKATASQLIMQTDGNLCLYTFPGGSGLWCSSAQAGGAQSQLVMQSDGNLCVVVPQAGQQPKPIWCTGTFGNPGAYLALGADGHAAIVRGSTVLWKAP